MPPPSAPPSPASPRVWHRIEFAGGEDGEWTIRDYESQQCADGATMVFWWESEMPHDLVRLPSAEALASCNFSATETLAPEGLTGEHHLHCVGGETYHLACSVPGHCEAGQRVTVQASASVAAFDEAGEPQLHVSSWARMMLLLGYVASDEHVRRTRGSKPKAMDASTLWMSSRETSCSRVSPCRDRATKSPVKEPGQYGIERPLVCSILFGGRSSVRNRRG